ncbi:hypothetical protein LDO32_16985 [Luteimonas sp. Y-2-2-4F]|nr:hypothetical protein [Luteimonas sp. Y-2-2-4F]MCD9033412.1 hypothetical protein [Luteimonas sp. Y-2-2-4F]
MRHADLAADAAPTGVLQAYWRVDWIDGRTEARTLHLRFFPDARSLAALPAIAFEDRPAAPPATIDLYRGGAVPSALDLDFAVDQARPWLDAVFGTVPADFLRHREGQIAAPARLRLRRLSSSVECDAQLYFGDIVALARADGVDDGLRDAVARGEGPAAGCSAATPWREYFTARPAAGADAVALRRAPDDGAPVAARLAAGRQLLKLRTVDEAWIEAVPRNAAETAPVEIAGAGYVRRDELDPVN